MSINIKQFFSEDYITFASYDNQRKLNKITDGLKISQRKVLYTILILQRQQISGYGQGH